jgi:hypothetical protein
MKTGRSAVFCGVSLSVAGEEGGSSRLERGSGHRHFAIWFEVAEHCAKLEAEPFPRVERRELGCVD